MTNVYRAEAIDLSRYKTEMDKLADRRKELERMQQYIERRSRQKDSSRKALDQLEAFCEQMTVGLENMTFEERQQFLRLVVEGITVLDGRIKVETVIPTDQYVKLRNVCG